MKSSREYNRKEDPGIRNLKMIIISVLNYMEIYCPPLPQYTDNSPKHIINISQETEILGILLKYFTMQPKKYIFSILHELCQRMSEYYNIKKYTVGIQIHHTSHTLVTSSNPFFGNSSWTKPHLFGNT